MRKPVTKSERIQRLKSLRDNINEVKDDHGFFYRYDIKSPKVMYIEMVSLTEMEYLVKLDKSRYFLKNEIKDEDIDSLADYAVELAAEYKSMNKEKEKTKKRTN